MSTLVTAVSGAKNPRETYNNLGRTHREGVQKLDNFGGYHLEVVQQSNNLSNTIHMPENPTTYKFGGMCQQETPIVTIQ